MGRIAKIAAFAVAMSCVGSAHAAGKLLCATATVHECVPGNGCTPVAHGLADVPHFIAVDLEKKEARGLLPDGERLSEIHDITELGESIVVRGLDAGDGDGRSARGWVATLATDRGDFVLTAAGNGVAFVVLGSCIAQERIAPPR
jgi:hypothetical protein